MVLSIFGGAMVGSVAAGTDTAELSDSIVTSSEEVTVSGEHSDDASSPQLYIVADANQNGDYDSGEATYQIPADSVNEDGTYEETFNPTDAGTLAMANGDTVDVYVNFQDPENGESLDRFGGELTIDDDAPTSEYVAPAEGERIGTTTPIFDRNITDDNSGVNASSIQISVTGPNGEIYTHKIDPQNPEDGVNWDGDNLTVDFGADNIPELPEGQIDTTVVAEDEAGNQATFTSSFIVDLSPIGINLEAPTSGTTVSDSTQNIQVSFDTDSGESIESASITVEGPDYSVTNDTDDAVYDSGTQTFTLDPGTSTGVPELPDGDIIVSVTAEDDSGNQDSATYGFHVDTSPPEVTDITVVGAEDGIINATESNTQDGSDGGVDVIVEFNESVTADSVTAEVRHSSNTALSFTQYQDSENAVVAEAPITAGIESEGVSVNVTGADDDVSNSFSGDENVSFDVDTALPSVSYGSDFPNPVSGFVDVAEDVTISGADGNERTYLVVPAGDFENEPVVLDNPTHVDTQQLPEGQHAFMAYARDDAGNYPAFADANVDPWTVDNDEPDVTYVGPETLSGEIVPEELVDVDNEGVEDYVVKWSAPGESTFQTGAFNVNEQGEGTYDIRVTVDDPGYDGADDTVQETFQVEGATLDVVSSSVTPDDEAGTFEVSFTTDVQLDAVHVDYYAVDEHFQQDEGHFDLSNFEETQTDDGFQYTATIEAPRDGEFDFQIIEAESGGQTLGGHDFGGTNTIDAEDPQLVDATISGADSDGRTQVELQFSEPVASVNAAPQFEGAAAQGVLDGDATDGTVVLQLDDILQTGDDTEATFDAGALDEVYGSDANRETSTVVDTVDLQLSEGNNLVSVPAATGRLDISELDTSNVDAIWAYDDGEWVSYDPAAAENDLTVLEGGQGYVFNMEAADEVPVRVYNVPGDTDDDAPAVPGSEDIENGWNLMGHFQEASQERDTALSTISDSYSADKVLGETDSGSYQPVTTLEPGEAYWVFAEGEDVYAEQPFTDSPVVFHLESRDIEGDQTYDNLDAVSSEEVLIAAGVDDPDGVDSVTFDSNVDDTTATLTDDSGDGIYTAEVTMDLRGQSGEITVGTVTATDNVGEEATAGVDAYVNDLDTTVDATRLNEPSDGFATAGTTETTEVEWDVSGVSADGDADTITLVVDQTLADNTDLSSAVNSVETDDFAVESGPTIVNTDSGTNNGIQFQIAPDGQGDVSTTARVNVDFDYPSGEADYSFDAAVQDSDGSNDVSVDAVTVTADEPPTMDSATTADTDDDGTLDHISLTFSEPVDSVDASDYSLDQGTISSMSLSDDGTTAKVFLDQSNPLDTGATPTVTYTQDDDGTNTVDSTQQGLEVPDQNSVTADDGAAPVVLSITADTSSSTDNDWVDVQFSEQLDTSSIDDADFQVDKDTTNDGSYDTTDVTIVGTDATVDSDDSTVRVLLNDGALSDADNVQTSVVSGSGSLTDGSGNTVPTGVGSDGSSAEAGTVN